MPAALLLALLLALALPGVAQAATCTFDGSSSSSWHTADNWSCAAVPSAADDVVIPNPFSVAVTASASANSLRLGGGALLPATLSITGAAVVLDVDGGAASILDGTVNASLGADLLLAGATTWNSGSLGGDETGVVVNQGVLSIATAATGSSFVDWQNSGTIQYQGTDLLTIGQGTGGTILNTGQVGTSGAGGTLNVGQVLAGSGDWTAAAGTTLQFNGGALASGADLTGAGSVRLASNTLTVPAGANYAVAGSTLLGDGFLGLGAAGTTGRIQGEGGGRSGAGTLTVTGIAGQASQIATSFTTLDAGNTVIGDLAANDPDLIVSSPLTARSAATVTLEGQTAWNNSSVSGDETGLIVNQGVLSIATAATGSSFVDWQNSGTIQYQGTDSLTIGGNGGTVLNTGQVTVSTGQLNTGTYTQTSGTTTVAAGATLGSSPALQGGALTGTGTVVGNVNNSAGSVRPGASPGVLTIDGTYTQGAGGTLQTEIAGRDARDALRPPGGVGRRGPRRHAGDREQPESGARRHVWDHHRGQPHRPVRHRHRRFAERRQELHAALRPRRRHVARRGGSEHASRHRDHLGAGEHHRGPHAGLHLRLERARLHLRVQRGRCPFAACTTPFTTPFLPDGSHRFGVRAIDDLGAVDPTPATQTFQITTPQPPPPLPPNGLISPGGCLNTDATLKGKQLGPARLGRKLAKQRAIFTGANEQTRANLDRYCAEGGGTFRIGYPTPRLGRKLSKSLKRKVKGRVVLVLTSSPRFSLGGIEVGDTTADTRAKLKGERPFKVGSNTWYVARRGGARLLVKTRRGSVGEIGIGDKRLTGSPKAIKRFLSAWKIG